MKKVRILFLKNKIDAKGTKKNKINFISKSIEPWGTVAIIGKKTNGSHLSNLKFENGSGNYDSQFFSHQCCQFTIPKISIFQM